MNSRRPQNQHPLFASAKKSVGRGWAIFECKPSKAPATKHGFLDAKADAEQVGSWKDKATVGVATGKVSGIVAFDCDVDEARGVDGEKWFREIQEHHGPLPPHPIARTPRGGSHHYFAYPEDREVRCSAGVVADGVDVRADGGYVIAPDSVTPKGAYTWEVDPDAVSPPAIPVWLLDAIFPLQSSPAPIVEDDAREISDADRELIAKLFRRHLDEVEQAKEGRRNSTLNKCAFLVGKLVGAGGLDEETAGAAMVDSAIKSGLSRQEACATIRSAFKAGKKRPWRPRVQDKLLNDLNADYFFSTEGKTSLVFREDLDPYTGERTLRRLYPSAFKDKFANQEVLRVVGDKVQALKLGQAWFGWRGRRQYDRVTFVPGRELPPTIYNPWQGFAAEAVEGDCSSFVDLLRDVLCDDDETLFNYVIFWCARAVQQPWNPGEVALVLQGSKGVGKSFFASHFGEMFGAHYVELTQARHLTGNFNAHLETAVLVFSDEAYWAGDKQGEATLKALVTSRHHLVERKGIDAQMARNYVHIIMASNSDWVVPASMDERRFCVVKVPTKRQNDHVYFGKLEEDWQNGGREAFLYYLLHLDLATFNVRRVPQTEALLEQKLQSLGTIDRWLLDALRNGEISSGDGWPEWVSTKEMFLNFKDFCNTENLRVASREGFGMRLGTLLPPRPDGRSTRCQRQLGNKGREWGYELASLAVCRARFCELIGFELEWETSGQVADAPDKSGGRF